MIHNAKVSLLGDYVWTSTRCKRFATVWCLRCTTLCQGNLNSILSGFSADYEQVPESVDLASAATYPDNFITAYFVLFYNLGLPVPSAFPATAPPLKAASPILVYGAGSTAAQYIVQLLKLAGYTNILTTASKKHHAYLSELGATKNFDYASPTLAEDIRKFAGGSIPIAIDVISTFGTLGAISKVIDPKGKLAVLLPVKEGQRLTDGAWLEEIPKDRSPFAETVDILYIGTFKYMMTVSFPIYPQGECSRNN